MADLKLSLAMSLNDRTRAVIEGRIKPEAIEFRATPMHPSEIFWRQLHFGEFDVSEMSMSSLLMAVANGNRDWVGIPVFTSRRFFHTGVWVRRDSGIETPADLHGKRVGVPEYQQTAALWTRGVLTHEFGFDPMQVEWWMERTEERSHGGATGFRPPPGLSFNRIPADTSMGAMLVEGTLDAALLYLNDRNLVDRSRILLEDRPEMRLMFDPGAEGRRFYAKTGLFPINHGMVVRRSVAEEHPWVVLNILNAFTEAKNRWLAGVQAAAQVHMELGLLPPGAADALAVDPFPYGVVGNRRVLETIAAYSHEQGLTPRAVGIDELFGASTLEV